VYRVEVADLVAVAETQASPEAAFAPAGYTSGGAAALLTVIPGVVAGHVGAAGACKPRHELLFGPHVDAEEARARAKLCPAIPRVWEDGIAAIRADLREQGLARQLLEALMGVIAAQGVRHAVMRFPAGQARILAIAKELGFDVKPDDSELRASKPLQNPMR